MFLHTLKTTTTIFEWNIKCVRLFSKEKQMGRYFCSRFMFKSDVVLKKCVFNIAFEMIYVLIDF